MSFTLDTNTGKGSKTVKITADPNTEGIQKTAKILVQVDGVTKQVVQLVQKAYKANYQVFVQTDVTSIGLQGGEVKVTYWVTLDGEMSENIPELTGVVDVIDSGVDSDGKHWIIDNIPANHGDVTYVATFDYISVNTKVIQRISDVILTTNKSYIPGNGGTATLSYWLIDDNNNGIIGDNLELVLEEDSDPIEYTLGTPFKDSSGKVNQVITVFANTVNEIKKLKFHARYTVTGDGSSSVEVRLIGKDMTLLPNFNFLTLNCEWDDLEDGTEFKFATFVTGSKINISNRLLDNYFVGFTGNGNDNQEVNKYISLNGLDGSFINWKEICNRDLISQGVTKLYGYIYGNWNIYKITGDVRIGLCTYKGTGMIKNGSIYVPDRNTELVSKKSQVINCNAYSVANTPSGNIDLVKEYYSLLATIEYDVSTLNAVFKPNLNRSGRSVEPSMDFEGEVITFSGIGEAYKEVTVVHGEEIVIEGTFNWSHAIEKIITDSGTEHYPMYVSDEPDILIMDEEPWINFNFIRDEENHIVGVSYQANDYTGVIRTAELTFIFSSVVGIRNTFTLTVIQNA